MVRVCLRPQMLALAPLFVYSNWFYAYQFACFNAALFSARTQVLLPPPADSFGCFCPLLHAPSGASAPSCRLRWVLLPLLQVPSAASTPP